MESKTSFLFFCFKYLRLLAQRNIQFPFIAIRSGESFISNSVIRLLFTDVG